ncbi:MAG: hypothetical protein JWQ78_469 [Sediminibacterium sp.]|nr:hypothetical protein [Sediminibacterium sp.]
MHDANRDLLVLAKAAQLGPKELEQEVLWLNRILYSTETWETFCLANEILDINRRRITRAPYLMQKILSEKKLRPFIFTSNKN